MLDVVQVALRAHADYPQTTIHNPRSLLTLPVMTLTASLFIGSILELFMAAHSPAWEKPMPLAKAIGDPSPWLALVLAAGSMSASEVSAMPTVIEPKTNEDAQAQPVPPVSNEPELFAAEIAMEGKNSGFMPLLLIAGLILVVGGTIFYFVKGARDVLTVPVATSTVTRILNAQGPATIRFSTGTVVSNVNEKPHGSALQAAGEDRRHCDQAERVTVR